MARLALSVAFYDVSDGKQGSEIIKGKEEMFKPETQNQSNGLCACAVMRESYKFTSFDTDEPIFEIWGLSCLAKLELGHQRET